MPKGNKFTRNEEIRPPLSFNFQLLLFAIYYEIRSKRKSQACCQP
jgi:hypothetical protein